MACRYSRWLRFSALAASFMLAAAVPNPAHAQAPAKKPNIVVIMGDDIGMWNIGAYHRGLMAGKTPNLTVISEVNSASAATPTIDTTPPMILPNTVVGTRSP
jgi:hypothetical protein